MLNSTPAGNRRARQVRGGANGVRDDNPLPGPTGTETAVEVNRCRPWGCRPCPAYKPRPGTCAAARSPGLGPILSRFCLEPTLSRDKTSNLASYASPRHPSNHITKVSSDRRLDRELCREITVPNGTAFQILGSGQAHGRRSSPAVATRRASRHGATEARARSRVCRRRSPRRALPTSTMVPAPSMRIAVGMPGNP